MSDYHLAQLNVGTMLAPEGSPVVAEFFENLDRINQLAETSKGFVWRLQDEGGNATELRPIDDTTLVNMSVWKDMESLHQFVYKTAHVNIMHKRAQWFEKMMETHLVLWWIPKGEIPTIQEATLRLESIRQNGATEYAFSFKQPFLPPSAETE